jgi:polysaccharide export outer membrane protein
MNRVSLTLKISIPYFVLIIFTSSCVDTKKIAYLSDVQDSLRVASIAGIEAVIQPKDILSIEVSSVSPEATAIFNTPNVGSPGVSSGTSSVQTAGYLVDQRGEIKFPLLGDIKAAGLTPKEIENFIYKELVDRKLLYDPVVSVRLINFRVTVLGEVNRPGVIIAPNEQLNVLEALGQAGDLTIFGIRDNIKLIRQDGDYKIVKRLNLNSSQLLNSPYFFLKSNDVLYVEPGRAKAASTVEARQVLPIILSGLSVITIILTRFI